MILPVSTSRVVIARSSGLGERLPDAKLPPGLLGLRIRVVVAVTLRRRHTRSAGVDHTDAHAVVERRIFGPARFYAISGEQVHIIVAGPVSPLQERDVVCAPVA